MVTWSYEVTVKSSVGPTMQNAINSLHAAQNIAADNFARVTDFLDGEDFSDDILRKLSSKLEDFETRKIEVEFKNQLDPLIKGINEIRSAVYMLMDIKTGSFAETVTKLQLATDALVKIENGKEVMIPMNDVFQNEYQKALDGALANKDIMLDKIKETLREIAPSFVDIETGAYLDFDLENGIYTDKFLEGNIGTINNFDEDADKIIIQSVISELQLLMKTLSIPDLRQVFVDIEKGDKKPLQDLEARLKTLRAAETSKDAILPRYQYNFNAEWADAAQKSSKAKKEIDDTDLVALKISYQAAMMKIIEDSGSSLLNDPTIKTRLQGDFFNEIIGTAYDEIQKGINRSGGSAGTNFLSKTKEATKDSTLFIIDLLEDSLRSQLNLENLTSNTQAASNKVYEELKNAGISPTEKNVKKGLLDELSDEYNLIAVPLVDHIMALINNRNINVEDEYGSEYIAKIVPDELQPWVEAIQHSFFKSGFVADPKWRSKRLTKVEEQKQAAMGETVVNDSLENIGDFTMQQYFEDAKYHRIQQFDESRARFENIFNTVVNSEQRLRSYLGDIYTAIQSIEIPKTKQIPSTSSDYDYSEISGQ